MSYFILRESQAQMPSSVRSRYVRLGVLEVEDSVSEVSAISKSAKGVIRIVRTWEKLHVGKTERCAYRIALAEARELMNRLNDEVLVAAEAARERAEKTCPVCGKPHGYLEHTCNAGENT
jgi:DNA repair exonuclease SbcCD ATPase subunit